ncbi:hypothetical protein BDY21DRAFT_392115 [Lineolata rhizophorae]|uniref:Uncharacterized protein n=1 Tax=Lineolata rhizophorae TaxID=578093 RepID=A0A6A6NZB7_9PEZI|nr:hypothetical protein BDY21DRAFT_392115 [Lineolata rhizophorae]
MKLRGEKGLAARAWRWRRPVQARRSVGWAGAIRAQSSCGRQGASCTRTKAEIGAVGGKARQRWKMDGCEGESEVRGWESGVKRSRKAAKGRLASRDLRPCGGGGGGGSGGEEGADGLRKSDGPSDVSSGLVMDGEREDGPPLHVKRTREGRGGLRVPAVRLQGRWSRPQESVRRATLLAPEHGGAAGEGEKGGLVLSRLWVQAQAPASKANLLFPTGPPGLRLVCQFETSTLPRLDRIYAFTCVRASPYRVVIGAPCSIRPAAQTSKSSGAFKTSGAIRPSSGAAHPAKVIARS